MSSAKRTRRKNRSKTAVVITLPQLLAACILPPVAGWMLQSVAGGGFVIEPGNMAPFFAGIGLISWVLGIRWFNMKEMGLRGKRPLFSSIGFATLGWVILFIVRFIFISLDPEGMNPTNAGRTFVYLLLFEGFAVQLWTFGLLFRLFSGLRSGIAAVFGSGIIFGIVAFLFFREGSFDNSAIALIYFIAWGVLYGIIRLRTGSLLGSVLIQALHTFTVWDVLAAPVPLPAADVANLAALYLTATLGYAIIVWRLWPKEAADLRI